MKHSKSTVSSRLVTDPSTHSHRGREMICSVRPDLVLSFDHDHKMACRHCHIRSLDNLHGIIIYDLLLNVYSALLLLKVCLGFSFRIYYPIVYTALSLSPLYKMKPLSLLVALQATHLTQSLPLLQAQAPNDILAAGIQSLPLSSKTPDTTGVRLSHLAHIWRPLLIASEDNPRRA